MSRWLDPALRGLVALKLRGRARVGWRRLRTPKGLLFGLCGGALFVLWLAGLVLRLAHGAAPTLEVADTRAIASVAIVLYAMFAVTANLSWRGLYLPRSEVERLFSAPVGRRELVRYRMLGMFVPTTFVALFVGIVTAARVATPLAGFLGGALVVLTTTVLGQGAALVAAREEGALARLLARVPGGLPRLLGALGLGAVLLLLLFASELGPTKRTSIVRNGQRIELDLEDLGPLGARPGRGAAVAPRGSLDGQATRRFTEFARHPATRVATAPAYPFAAAVSAPTLAAATPWLVASLLILLLSFEVVARLRVDYREASLATTREVEQRLERLRRGQFGAAGGEVRVPRGWRVPWVFGKSPLGAVLWLQSAKLVRQGRSALTVALLTSVFGVFVGVWALPDAGAGTMALAVLGVAYLSSGLRFDFRSELDRMERLRAWPLAPWQVFVAVILPVTMFVAFFVTALLGVRGYVLGDLSLEVLTVMASTPLVAFLWVALDNAMFLLFPVRFVPGQGGALQHSGRALLMVALRLALLAAVSLVAFAASLASVWVGEQLELGPAVLGGLAGTSALMVLIATAAGLARFGGWSLARFDPSHAALAPG
ncbi:MAG: hypothetical protein R3F49_22920 [Planctomycetota bacterium]